jgi:hypothetical protein
MVRLAVLVVVVAVPLRGGPAGDAAAAERHDPQLVLVLVLMSVRVRTARWQALECLVQA